MVAAPSSKWRTNECNSSQSPRSGVTSPSEQSRPRILQRVFNGSTPSVSRNQKMEPAQQKTSLSLRSISEQSGSTTRAPSPEEHNSNIGLSQNFLGPSLQDVPSFESNHTIMTANQFTEEIDKQIVNVSNAFEHSISTLQNYHCALSPTYLLETSISSLTGAGINNSHTHPSLKDEVHSIQSLLKELQGKIELQQQQQREFITNTEKRLAALEHQTHAGIKAFGPEVHTNSGITNLSANQGVSQCIDAALTVDKSNTVEALMHTISKLQMDVECLSLKLHGTGQHEKASGPKGGQEIHGQRGSNTMYAAHGGVSNQGIQPNKSMPPHALPIENLHPVLAQIPHNQLNPIKRISSAGCSMSAKHMNMQQCAPIRSRSLTAKTLRESRASAGASNQGQLSGSFDI